MLVVFIFIFSINIQSFSVVLHSYSSAIIFSYFFSIGGKTSTAIEQPPIKKKKEVPGYKFGSFSNW
jgi:hypothetical protein